MVEDAAEPVPDAQVDRRLEIEKHKAKLKSGANWYYWIAGLSVINSAIVFFGGQWSFIVGLGITQVFDALGAGAAEESAGDGAVAIRVLALALSLGVAGVFVLFGWLANNRKGWAFGLGMTLYALDGLLFILVQDWLSFGFHAFALFCLFGGYSALKKLRALGQEPAGIAVAPTAG